MVEIAPPINDPVDSNRREIHNAIPKGNSLMDIQAMCQAACQVADIP